MPFTFSHPAIVLPLAAFPKRYFSLTGLVMGSMAPDFEYFIRMNVKGKYGHTLAGIFWFDLPLSLMLAYLFHFIVRNPLILHLPPLLNKQLIIFSDFNWHIYFSSNWPAVLLSILIGTGSHLFWDAFTHYDGYFVQIFPLLAQPIHMSTFSIPLFKLLQHSSSLLGAIVVLYAIFRSPQAAATTGDDYLKYWGCIALIALTIVVKRVKLGLGHNYYGNLIVTGIAALLIALTVVSFFFKTRKV